MGDIETGGKYNVIHLDSRMNILGVRRVNETSRLRLPDSKAIQCKG